jgi:uncharacterized protein (UPF0305 family)
MKSLFSFFKKHNVMKIFKVILLHVFIVFIGKYIYNRYTHSYEPLIEKKQLKMLNEINSLLDTQKQEQEDQQKQQKQ